MSNHERSYVAGQAPIYDKAYEAGVVDSRTFTLCLGIDGGYFQLGGYTSEYFLGDQTVYPMLTNHQDFYIGMSGVSINDHFIKDSEIVTQVFIDSGKTTTALTKDLFEAVISHIAYFCDQSKDYRRADGHRKYCHGGRFTDNWAGEDDICFAYDQDYFEGPEGLGRKHFFLGYPIIRFHVSDVDGLAHTIDWLPSEYFFYDSFAKAYCFSADKRYGSNTITLGGTTMH